MRLFDRGIMPVALTEHGRRCRRAPSGSLTLPRAAREEVAAVSGQIRGTVTLGTTLHTGHLTSPASRQMSATPPVACAPPLAQRLLHLANRRGEGLDHRHIGYGHLPRWHPVRRHPVRRCVPAGHHPARSSRLPAQVLMALHHERWEHEITYLALRHTLLQGRVLRSGDPAVLEQEIWALLALYRQ